MKAFVEFNHAGKRTLIRRAAVASVESADDETTIICIGGVFSVIQMPIADVLMKLEWCPSCGNGCKNDEVEG